MKRLEHAYARLRAALIWVILAPIRAYSRLISPALPRRCKYHPTCSDYAQQAVRTHGILRGGALAAWRLARCNPWSRGGVDDVPRPGDWRASFHRPFSQDPETRRPPDTHGARA